MEMSINTGLASPVLQQTVAPKQLKVAEPMQPVETKKPEEEEKKSLRKEEQATDASGVDYTAKGIKDRLALSQETRERVTDANTAAAKSSEEIAREAEEAARQRQSIQKAGLIALAQSYNVMQQRVMDMLG